MLAIGVVRVAIILKFERILNTCTSHGIANRKICGGWASHTIGLLWILSCLHSGMWF